MSVVCSRLTLTVPGYFLLLIVSYSYRTVHMSLVWRESRFLDSYYVCGIKGVNVGIYFCDVTVVGAI